MCIKDFICASPLQDGRRCNKERIGESLHCIYHAKEVRSSHFNYKKYQRLAEAIDNPTSIEEYKKLWFYTLEEYRGRIKHMNDHFIEEKRDPEGHLRHINNLKEKADIYEKKLTELYSIPSNELSTSSDKMEVEKVRKITRVKVLPICYKSLTEERKRVDKGWREIEENYIRVLADREKITNLIYSFMKSTLVRYNNDEQYYIELTAIIIGIYIGNKCTLRKYHDCLWIPLDDSEYCYEHAIEVEQLNTVSKLKEFYRYCLTSTTKYLELASRGIREYRDKIFDNIALARIRKYYTNGTYMILYPCSELWRYYSNGGSLINIMIENSDNVVCM